jgi:4-amino-4-deoxy-L-arabinose transferase-like glycosyltransferase
MLQVLSRTKALLFLATITLLIRLPFFFPDVIDHDESTFILMGQDILDGNLPYVKLWDNKPPLIFFYFAFFISLFGKSIPAIRLGGTLCLFAAACFLFLAGERTRSPRAGFLAALLLIVFTTVSSSGGCTMSEIVAIVPLTGAALLLLKDQLGEKDFFLVGVILSCACLIRLNLAYLAILAGIFLSCGRSVQTQTGLVRRTALYIAGGAVPVVLFFLPYYFSGETRTFIDSLFFAPLAYSQSQMSFWGAGYAHLERFADVNYALQNSLITITFIGGLLYIGLAWGEFSRETRSRLFIVMIFLIGTGFSILKTGSAFENHLIQIIPFVALIAGVFLDYLLSGKRSLLFMAIGLLLMIPPSYIVISAYSPMVHRAAAEKRLTYGATYEIADFLKASNPDNDPVYFMEGHLAHWFTNTKPISKIATHPSNVGREYLLKVLAGPSATVESELSAILDKEPAFIVMPSTVTYLSGHPHAKELLFQKIFMDYVLVKEIGRFLIYKRMSFLQNSQISLMRHQTPGSSYPTS